ncbi:MAG TPA: hypothetical protein DCG10_09045 [Lachnospiraceae bacterium]|nr:hypothetical protein [Lachnospiraceae bacterium]
MKRKIILALMTVCILSFASCGKQETTSTTESVPATVESTQVETTVTEENVTIETEATTEETMPTDSLTDEITDNIVYPDVNPEDVDPKTTNMDAETATALAQQEGKEIDAQYGSEEAWTGYAQSQGADGTLGWCWIYYTGQGAGDQESYAVYMKEDSPRYGEVFHLGDYLPGGDFFVGANNKEHGIADDRELQRKYDNGELGDGITITENGDIIIE